MAPLQRIHSTSSFSLGVGELSGDDDSAVIHPVAADKRVIRRSVSFRPNASRSSSFASIVTDASSDGNDSVVVANGSSCVGTQRVDMTGAYQLVENHNFEQLLAVQGVPWALRRAANKLRPIHRFTHVKNDLTIKVEGIIETQSSYVIGGPPVTCEIRGRKFQDTLEYLSDGIQTLKHAVDDGYTIIVSRRLSKDRKTLTMTSTVKFGDPSKEEVQATQIFQLMAGSGIQP